MSESQVPVSVTWDSLLLLELAAGNHAEQRWEFVMSGGEMGDIVISFPVSGLTGDL